MQDLSSKYDRYAMTKVLVFSSPNILSLGLSEFLLAQENQFEVDVFTNDPNGWREKTVALGHNARLKIFNLTEPLPDIANYAFLVEGYGFEVDKEGLAKILDQLSRRNVKTLAVVSFVRAGRKSSELYLLVKQKIGSDFDVQTVFTGEIYGPRMDFGEESQVLDVFKDASLGRPIKLPTSDFEIFIVYAGELVREIVKTMFSYGYPEGEVVISEKTTFYKLLEELKRAGIKLAYVEDKSVDPQETFVAKNFIKIKGSENSLKETINWLKKKYQETVFSPTQKVVLKKAKVKKPKKRKVFIGLVVILFWLLALPFVLIFASGASLSLAYNRFLNNDWNSASFLFKSTQRLAAASGLGVGGKIGFVKDGSHILEKAGQIGERGIGVSKYMVELLNHVTGEEDYDLNSLSENLSLELNVLYQDVSFLETEIGHLPLTDRKLIPGLSKLSEARKYLSSASEITKYLPSLLGQDQTRSYMVLFQNNMELRPTGGFIGSFALVTFNKGKLIDMEVLDVYSADGQLKGHVEPPVPIKNYLGEANWFLRDSNWDPDFPTSAQRAEWFLEKEMDRGVDGVIAVDLELARSILKETGPLMLADFNQQIDEKNLYERVQYEVESEFFPGSRKKANFLTALSQALMTKVLGNGDANYLGLGKLVLDNLEERHIQIFLHETEVLRAVSKLGWDGAVKTPLCGDNCQPLLVGLAEANLGVNKSNYFIQRSMSLVTTVNEKSVENKMEVVFKNNASTALGVQGTYKNYIRLITNSDSEIKGAEIVEPSQRKVVVPETKTVAGRKESGLLLEVKPGQQKRVVFTWSVPVKVDFSKKGEMPFLWRKQAGTTGDLVNLQIKTPPFVLTKGDTSAYNTVLSRDINSLVYW